MMNIIYDPLSSYASLTSALTLHPQHSNSETPQSYYLNHFLHTLSSPQFTPQPLLFLPFLLLIPLQYNVMFLSLHLYFSPFLQSSL